MTDSNKLLMVTETVYRGRRFRNHLGREILLAWDKDVQECLGLPFEVFEKMEKRRHSDYQNPEELRKQIREINEMTFWGKIKFLFFKKVSGI